MEPVYTRLVAIHRQDGLSLRGVSTFNLDEYIGASVDDVWSLRRFTLDHLVEPTDLPADAAHAPDGMARDVFAEADRYEQTIRRAGGIDLQLLGLGRNGHIGFNEPGSSLGSWTRVKALTAETLRANRDDLPAVAAAAPQAAITMGLGTILAARACLLLAIGAAKSRAVAAMIEGPVTARVPASALQHHPRVMAILDEASAGELEDHEYYRAAERLQRRLEERAPVQEG